MEKVFCLSKGILLSVNNLIIFASPLEDKQPQDFFNPVVKCQPTASHVLPQSHLQFQIVSLFSVLLNEFIVNNPNLSPVFNFNQLYSAWFFLHPQLVVCPDFKFPVGIFTIFPQSH